MTAQGYSPVLPSTATPPTLSDGGVRTGKTWYDRLGQFFGTHDQEQNYQNALTENNREYEQAMLREQRAYDEYLRNWNAMREDTVVQRQIADIKAAGLNPWLALQGGGVSSSGASQATPSQSASVSSGSSAKSKSGSSRSSGLAMLLFATARLISSI